jgi:hypothetical protein
LSQAASAGDFPDIQPNPFQLPPIDRREEPTPRKPGKAIPTLIVMILFCGTCSGINGVLRANRTVAVVSGQELSNAEVKIGMEEVSEMLKTYSPQNPEKFQTNLQPSNAFSAAFKEFFVGNASDQKELEEAISSVNIDTLLGESLASRTGRREAKIASEKITEAVRKCLDSQLGRLTKYSDSFTRPKLSESALGTNRARLVEARNGYEEVNRMRLKIIEFTEQAKPSFAEGQLLFSRDRDVTSFNALVEAYNAKLEEFQAKLNSDLAIQKSAVSELTNLFAPESQ